MSVLRPTWLLRFQNVNTGLQRISYYTPLAVWAFLLAREALPACWSAQAKLRVCWYQLTHRLMYNHKSYFLDVVGVLQDRHGQQEPELKTYSEVMKYLDLLITRYTNDMICKASTLVRLDKVMEVFDETIESETDRGLSILRHTSVSEKKRLLTKVFQLVNLTIQDVPPNPNVEEIIVTTSCALMSLMSLRVTMFRLFDTILQDESVQRSPIFVEAFVYDLYAARRVYGRILDLEIDRVYGSPSRIDSDEFVDLMESLIQLYLLNLASRIGEEND